MLLLSSLRIISHSTSSVLSSSSLEVSSVVGVSVLVVGFWHLVVLATSVFASVIVTMISPVVEDYGRVFWGCFEVDLKSSSIL